MSNPAFADRSEGGGEGWGREVVWCVGRWVGRAAGWVAGCIPGWVKNVDHLGPKSIKN